MKPTKNYHFAKKHKIYILNFKKRMRQESPRKPIRLVYRSLKNK